MVGDRARGRGEGEHVVDRRRHLEGALVAVAHDAGDPFRVDDAGAHGAGDLLLQPPHHRALGPGMVGAPDHRRLETGRAAWSEGEGQSGYIVGVTRSYKTK